MDVVDVGSIMAVEIEADIETVAVGDILGGGDIKEDVGDISPGVRNILGVAVMCDVGPIEDEGDNDGVGVGTLNSHVSLIHVTVSQLK